MFNWSKERPSQPAKPKADTAATEQREYLKELEAQVPEIRMKLMTEPEEATLLCRQTLSRLYDLDVKVGQWREKPKHKRDVLEMSLLNFLAQSLSDNADWSATIQTYERCLALGAQLEIPDFQASSLLNLGKAYRHAGDLAQAAHSFEQAVRLCQQYDLSVQQAESLYQRAVVAELQNQPQVALMAYGQGLELSESERLYDLAVRFLSQLGQLQQGLGGYPAAIDNYERCLKYLRETDDDKESETIILGQISNICTQTDDFELGIKSALEGLDYSRQTKQTAEEAAFLEDLARLYMGSGKAKQARKYAIEARDLAQLRQDQVALQEAEQLLAQLAGDIETTEVSFRSLSEVIQVPEVHYQLGNRYYREGALDRAISSYSRAINLNQNYTAAFINRGSVYTGRGEYDHALADYNRAIQLNPSDPVAYFNRGNVYRKRREYLPALTDYTEAIRLDPSDPDAYFNRGEIYRRMKRNAEAIADFERVLTMSAGKDEAGAAQARRRLTELGQR